MNGDDLLAALVAAFPPTTITHAMVHASDARWIDYEEREHLSQLEGACWNELTTETLERHASLLVHAGNELYRAILAAYLQLLAGEHHYATMLPFVVLGEVTKNGSSAYQSELFETRVGPLSTEQRAVVRRALTAIAMQPVLHDAATAALRAW